MRRMALCFVPGDARAQISFWLRAHSEARMRPRIALQRKVIARSEIALCKSDQ